MALTESTTITGREVGTEEEFYYISEVSTISIFRDGNKISDTEHRGVHYPGYLVGTPPNEGEADTRTYTRTDVTGFSSAFQAIANALWTDELHQRYEAHLRA